MRALPCPYRCFKGPGQGFGAFYVPFDEQTDMNASDTDLLALIRDLDRRLGALTTEVSVLRQTMAAIPAAAAKPAAEKAPATEKKATPLNLALVGGGLHGAKSLKALLALKDCKIAYVCDVDAKKGAARASEIQANTGQAPKLTTDFREALADPDRKSVV